MLSLVLGEFVSYETVSFRKGRRFILFTAEFFLLRGERQTFISLQWRTVATAFIVWENLWENVEVLVAQISPYLLLSSIFINTSINTHMGMVDAD